MIHVDFFHVVKKNKAEFLTTWSFDESLSSGLNMSEFNVYENIFSLDRNLFHRTGQKVYHATGSRRYIKEVQFAGEMSPYQRKTYFAGIGESVSLYCSAVVSNNCFVVFQPKFSSFKWQFSQHKHVY